MDKLARYLSHFLEIFRVLLRPNYFIKIVCKLSIFCTQQLEFEQVYTPIYFGYLIIHNSMYI